MPKSPAQAAGELAISLADLTPAMLEAGKLALVRGRDRSDAQIVAAIWHAMLAAWGQDDKISR